MSFRPSQLCSCGVPSVHGLSGPAGLPLLRVSSSQFSVVECGVFVGCQCSHICVLPCTLCPLFCCCLYILYVIASLCICNCLCLCTFFLCFSTLYQPTCVFVCPFTCCCMYILYVNFSVPASVWVPVFVPSTTLHVFMCTPLQMVTLCLYVYSGAQSIYAPLTTVVFFPLGTSIGLADYSMLSLLWPATMHTLVRSLSRPCLRRTFFTRSSIGR